jgi:predicted S18 family serine protease
MRLAVSDGHACGGMLLLVAMLGLGACSSVPPPEQQLANADSAVREAEEANAASEAPAPLRRARDKLEQARNAMDAEEYVDARRLAEQAAVDAELAEVQARSTIAQENVEELRRSIELLREEATQKTPTTS